MLSSRIKNTIGDIALAFAIVCLACVSIVSLAGRFVLDPQRLKGYRKK